MFDFTNIWQVYEFKLLVLFVTGVIAVVLGNHIHDRIKDKL